MINYEGIQENTIMYKTIKWPLVWTDYNLPGYLSQQALVNLPYPVVEVLHLQKLVLGVALHLAWD